MLCHGYRGVYLIDPEELVGLVRGSQPFEQVGKAGQNVAISGGERIIGDRVGGRLKVMEVAQQEAQREAQLPVHVRHLGQHLWTHHHVPCRRCTQRITFANGNSVEVTHGHGAWSTWDRSFEDHVVSEFLWTLNVVWQGDLGWT